MVCCRSWHDPLIRFFIKSDTLSKLILPEAPVHRNCLRQMKLPDHAKSHRKHDLAQTIDLPRQTHESKGDGQKEKVSPLLSPQKAWQPQQGTEDDASDLTPYVNVLEPAWKPGLPGHQDGQDKQQGGNRKYGPVFLVLPAGNHHHGGHGQSPRIIKRGASLDEPADVGGENVADEDGRDHQSIVQKIQNTGHIPILPGPQKFLRFFLYHFDFFAYKKMQVMKGGSHERTNRGARAHQ